AIDGRTAVVAPRRDVDALAWGLSRLVEDADLRRRLGRGGQGFVRTQFDWERATARLGGLLAARERSKRRGLGGGSDELGVRRGGTRRRLRRARRERGWAGGCEACGSSTAPPRAPASAPRSGLPTSAA